jgi:hypothetical protein
VKACLVAAKVAAAKPGSASTACEVEETKFDDDDGARLVAGARLLFCENA